MICIIHRVPINDEIWANILAYLEDTSDFIHRHVSKGHLVPVHCQMGISRSVTAVNSMKTAPISITHVLTYQLMCSFRVSTDIIVDVVVVLCPPMAQNEESL